MSALQAGISGMLAHQARMDAVGNNIANVNTTGYKSTRVTFADAFYQTLEPATGPSESLGGTNPSSLGQGVQVAGIETSFRQGSLIPTGRALDVAVQGEGFLAVTDGSQIYYTRHGALGLDAAGNLVHLASGLRVVATPPSDGQSVPGVTPTSTLTIPMGQTMAARPTTTVNLGGNLDSRVAAGGSHEMTMKVYDSLGNPHEVTLKLTRSATAGTWDVSGTSPDGAVTIPPPAQLTFGADGKPTVASLPVQLALTNPNGATAQMAMTASVTGLSQVAQESSAALRSQDGAPAGTLTGTTIGGDGTVLGVYSNGLTSPLGRVVTARFTNPGGLEHRDDSLFAATVNSGTPVYGVPGSGGSGTIAGGQLEGSNVNLTQELADMIGTQRGFQASSRVVSTADQMLQELMQLLG